MRSVLLTLKFADARTAVTVDINGLMQSGTKLVGQTSIGQVFFTGHQLGYTYANPGNDIFRAMTDNPNGSQNHFYDWLTTY